MELQIEMKQLPNLGWVTVEGDSDDKDGEGEMGI